MVSSKGLFPLTTEPMRTEEILSALYAFLFSPIADCALLRNFSALKFSALIFCADLFFFSRFFSI
jgi:hypothetical protein